MNSKFFEVNNVLSSASHIATVKSIQNGAVSSRDWQPLHTNQTWAMSEGKLPNIIMNNYTLNGLIIKYITDIYGHATRIGKVSFKMKKPICPEDVLEFQGLVIHKQKIDDSRSLLQVDVRVQVDKKISASAKVILAVNESGEPLATPWKLSPSEWSACLKLCQN